MIGYHEFVNTRTATFQESIGGAMPFAGHGGSSYTVTSLLQIRRYSHAFAEGRTLVLGNAPTTCWRVARRGRDCEAPLRQVEPR